MRPDLESHQKYWGLLKEWQGKVNVNFVLSILDHSTDQDYRWVFCCIARWLLLSRWHQTEMAPRWLKPTCRLSGFDTDGLHGYCTATEIVWCVNPRLIVGAAAFYLWLMEAACSSVSMTWCKMATADQKILPQI